MPKCFLRTVTLLLLMLASAGAGAVDYVFKSGNNFMVVENGALTATTTFNPQTCIWNATNTLNKTNDRTISITIDGTTYSLRGTTTNGGALTLGNATNFRSDGNLGYYNSRYYYVYYNNGWKCSRYDTSYGSNRTVPYAVTTTNATTPTFAISYPTPDAYVGNVGGEMTISANVNGNYRPKYYNFNGHYYLEDGTDYGTTAPSQVSKYTYTYELVGECTNYATISGNTVTYTKDAGHDVVAQVKVTAKPQGYDDVIVGEGTCSFTLRSATVSAPVITPGPGQNQYTITGPAGSLIKYTTDGTNIDEWGSNGTTYSGPITITTPNTVIKAKAVREGKVSTQAEYTINSITLAPPTITISDAGSVTITNPNGSVGTIHYTTDGSEPTTSSTSYSAAFPVNNMATVKAIVTGGDGYVASEVASKQYKIESGVSGGVVTLNDYEDHNWTYYSDPESPIKSLYPRNVKISYYGNGTNTVSTSNDANPASTTFTASTNNAVAVSKYESENTFVYYKTLERDANDRFPYELIPNPFSKRPTYGDNATTKWRGFYGWRIKSITNGKVYDNGTERSVGYIFTTEYQQLAFQPTDNSETNANNATSMEVEFEAVWARAYRVESTAANANGNMSSNTLVANSYERNFVVVSSGTSNTNLTGGSKPCTVTMIEPDGSTDYRTNIYLNPGYIIAQNNWKFEWINLRVSSTISANGKNLVIGRGVTYNGANGSYGSIGSNNTAAYINGLGNDTSNGFTTYNTNLDFILRVESGRYTQIGYLAANNGRYGATSSTIHVRGIFGNDYDRANKDNAKLESTGMVSYGYNNNAGIAANNTNNYNRETLFLNIKSGGIQSATSTSGFQPGNNGLYLGRSSGDAMVCGNRYLLFEGGSVISITGGQDRTPTNATTSDANVGVKTLTIRMRGTAEVRTSAFGGAAQNPTYGDRTLIITGGLVRGWVATGCNGIATAAGQNHGTGYMYVGGNAKIGDGTLGNINGTGRGIVMGAGNGRSDSETTGQMTFGSYVVIADDADIENNVFGGGNYGYTLGTANVNIFGGTVHGNVFGGANQKRGQYVNITMKGGVVEGGIYGGSNTTGTIENDVTIHIDGGQVGVDATHTANIHGGGYGQLTLVNGDVDVAIGKENATEGATIYGDVYGGSALGQVNATGTVNNNALSNVQYNSGKKTNVTLNAGTINGSLYGGALGSNDVAANVYGPVQVTVKGGSVKGGNSAVYGCNNLNGAPQSTVKVDIYKTDAHNDGSDEDDPADDIYAINAVYGGGNAADYKAGTPKVTVHGCDNSIEYVYGGGNAADVPSTDVTIYGGDKIGNVFGGGHGDKNSSPQKEANVGGSNAGTNPSGNVEVKIYGGTIGKVFAGSNSKGTIHGTTSLTVNKQSETEGGTACGMYIDEVYGGGNEAAGNAGTISVGCTGGEGEGIGTLYGGANNADIGTSANPSNIKLDITGGSIGNIFGGNNNGGSIYGTITVNVEWTDKAVPATTSGTSSCVNTIGNVYGAGNIAAYTGSPKVNILNAITTGSVFGGGKGATAVVTGNPEVVIGDEDDTNESSHHVEIGKSVFGGGDAAAVKGEPQVTLNVCGTLINEDVYGGGNAAPVYSTNVTMNAGTVLGNVFGGGNGKGEGNPGANVGYDPDNTTKVTSEDSYGTSTVTIHGGTVGTWSKNSANEDVCADETGGVFGGSNSKGDIWKGSNVNVEGGNTTNCPLKVKDFYGAGNEAFMNGTTHMNIGCDAPKLDYLFGGAKNADVMGSIELNILNGTFGKVFGGNNAGGRIYGSIKVNIDETKCSAIIIDELYGGGYNAPYDVNWGTYDPTTETGVGKNDDPEVNIISCTSIGSVFGGGYGKDATITGNTHVNINMVEGVQSASITNNSDKLGTIGTVFGGGNAANVVGDTYVNIGTSAKVRRVSETLEETDGKILNGREDDVVGANISGNVYGGGNQADVTGKTHVQVGPKPTN